MATYLATIDWSLREGDDFAKGRYSRAHTLAFDGGATVAGSPSPHVVPSPWSDPAGVDPEEAFIAALSACHMLWFLDLARREGWAVSRYHDPAQGIMAKRDDGRWAITRVTLRPTVTFADRRPDRDQLAGLHHRAHELCFIANSVNSEVVIEPQEA
jgi:organic hydroperoxide reductase OsmC/OhrA